MPKNSRIFFLFFAVGMLISSGFSFSEEIRYHAGGRRDPFVPVGRSAGVVVTDSGVAIEGIIYDPQGKSIVVIDGEPYRAGDQVGTQKIVEIKQSKIVVLESGKTKDYWISAADEQIGKKEKD